jgi:hypothetical protein
MIFDNHISSAVVCMRHLRFIPCRKCGDPKPYFWSSRSEDIEKVKKFQLKDKNDI